MSSSSSAPATHVIDTTPILHTLYDTVTNLPKEVHGIVVDYTKPQYLEITRLVAETIYKMEMENPDWRDDLEPYRTQLAQVKTLNLRPFVFKRFTECADTCAFNKAQEELECMYKR